MRNRRTSPENGKRMEKCKRKWERESEKYVCWRNCLVQQVVINKLNCLVTNRLTVSKVSLEKIGWQTHKPNQKQKKETIQSVLFNIKKCEWNEGRMKRYEIDLRENTWIQHQAACKMTINQCLCNASYSKLPLYSKQMICKIINNELHSGWIL